MEDGILEAEFENLQVADEATAELQVTDETTAEISNLSRKATSPWREWLNTIFPTTGRASDLSLLISTRGQTIPFESIEETQAAVFDVYTAWWLVFERLQGRKFEQPLAPARRGRSYNFIITH